MIDFIIQNWQFCIFCLLALAELLLLILKKRVKIDSLKEKLLEYLPLCIRLVEDFGLTGAETKKKACIDMLRKFVSFSDSYLPFVEKSIEAILSTPERKEIK